MTERELIELLDPVVGELGATVEEGEAYSRPPLEVLRYYRRVVKLGRLPVVGRALAITAVVRAPADLDAGVGGMAPLLDRLARAVNGRFPPRPLAWGLSIGLTAVVIASTPIMPNDEEALAKLETRLGRTRAVLLGAFRLDLERQAMTSALWGVSGDSIAEPLRVADTLAGQFGRFVPPFRS